MNLNDHARPIPVIRMMPPDQHVITGNRAHAGHSFTPVMSMEAMIMPGAGPGQGPKAQIRGPAVPAPGQHDPRYA